MEAPLTIQVVSMLVLLSLATALAAQEPVVQGPIGQRLDSAIQAAEAGGFHGTVLIAQRGATVLLKGYGFANHETNTHFSPSTLVQIGSNVKDFTKTAIYQLAEGGRLRLTDSLGQFFPDVAADKRGITIQQLLTHRAGLPLGAGGGDQRALTKGDMLRDLNTLQLLSPPGTQERYSNLGYALLAAIIERVTGQPFERYVAEQILRPAGLHDTGSHLAGFDRARIAHGYAPGNRDIGVILDLPHDETGHLYQLRGNGGYLSTVSDMLRYYHALPTLLRDEADRRAVFRTDGPNVLAGSDLTSFFLFANFPGAGAEIVIASNHADYNGERLMRALTPILGIRQPGGEGREVVETSPRPSPRSGPTSNRLPDTGPGRTVGAYLEAFNTGDTAVMRRFFTDHGDTGPGAPPVATRLERYQQMYGNLGRLTVRGVTESPDGLIVTAESGTGETVSLTFLIDPNAPYQLRGLRVEVG